MPGIYPGEGLPPRHGPGTDKALGRDEAQLGGDGGAGALRRHEQRDPDHAMDLQPLPERSIEVFHQPTASRGPGGGKTYGPQGVTAVASPQDGGVGVPVVCGGCRIASVALSPGEGKQPTTP